MDPALKLPFELKRWPVKGAANYFCSRNYLRERRSFAVALQIVWLRDHKLKLLLTPVAAVITGGIRFFLGSLDLEAHVLSSVIRRGRRSALIRGRCSW